MKHKLLLSTGIVTFLLIIVVYISFDKLKSNSVTSIESIEKESIGHSESESMENDSFENESKETGQSIERERKFFEDLHSPYGQILPAQMLENTWSAINSRPSESSMSDFLPANTWNCLGPYGFTYVNSLNQNLKFSGRVKDIQVNGVPTVRVASASGGLWKYMVFGIVTIPVPLSDAVPTPVVSTSATSPTDSNRIIIGTGEYYVRGGLGIYRTTNGGLNWIHANMSPLTPTAILKIRYAAGGSNIVHAATDNGYYRSSDGGLNWTSKLSYAANGDLAVHPTDSNIAYVSLVGLGIWKTTNAGLNWNLYNSGLPTAHLGRIALTICESNPSILYANVASDTAHGRTIGFYKTTNSGVNWQDVSFRPGGNWADFHWGQGFYANAISVNPVNPNIVIAGGGSLQRSSDGGITWVELHDTYHADIHSITWKSDGSIVYVGDDGGIQYSTNAGVSWRTDLNTLPVVQFYQFEAGVYNNGIVAFGAAQDNGGILTTNTGITTAGSYIQKTFGDGWACSLDPTNPNNIVSVNNGGNVMFNRNLSSNMGANWSVQNGGLTSLNSGAFVKNDKVSPAYFYTIDSNRVYYLPNIYSTWLPLPGGPLPSNVNRIDVSKYTSPWPVIYACTGTQTNNQLWVYDNGIWNNRGAGFPNNTYVYNVGQHPSNINKAYAIMLGIGSTQRIFKTTNRGVNWTNISGDLAANIPAIDVVPHPTNDNILFLATEYGNWKTTNAGVNWFRWNNGMPEGTIVTRMSFIDSSSVNGKFWILESTFGRGIWSREISGEDPIITGITGNTIPSKYELNQNYPNPFNPVTKIKFSIPVDDNVKIEIFDVTGRMVKSLINSKFRAGELIVDFNASEFSSGVYFYKMTTSRLTDVKKMILLK